MKRLAALVLLSVASCGQADRDKPLGPRDFALLLPVEADAGPLERIALPPAALAAIRRRDKGDIRVFDAQDRPLSLALLPGGPGELAVVRLKAIPFALPQSPSPGSSISVRVDRGAQAIRVKTDDASPAAPDHAVLLDTRQLNQPAVSITLDADVPVQRPVTVSLAVGGDLSHWQDLTRKVLFRPDQGAGLLGSGRIDLGGEVLGGRYLRVAWSGAPASMVTGASLATSPDPMPRRVTVAAKGAVMADPHHVLFTLPAGAGPTALMVAMTGRDGVVPIRLLGRAAADQPWAPLALASVRQGEKAALLELGDGGWREFMVEADTRSAGFSQMPRLDLQFAPVEVLAAMNGAAPYRLAVGQAKAPPAFFGMAELVTRPGPFPQARVMDDGRDVEIDVAIGKARTGLAPRIVALWAVLIGGVLVLAFAAYRLFRANDDQPQEP